MPCKKTQEPPTLCTPSSRQLLGSVPIMDLSQSICFCIQNSNADGGPGPSECGPCACDEDDSGPVTCCDLSRQYEPMPRSEQNQVIETCLPSCKSLEIEAMLDEMKRSQIIIRKLALDAMEILHPESGCPFCKREAPAQKGLNAKESYCDHCKNPKLFEPDIQSPTKPKLLKSPGSPLQSRAHSTTSSVPIAQTAFQIKDGRLPKTEKSVDTVRIKKKPKPVKVVDVEESLKKKSKEDTPATQTNAESYYQPYLEEEQSKCCLKKIFASKPSICSCDGERNLDVNCECKAKIDCRCGSKSYFQRIFGKKPSICKCSEDPLSTYYEDQDGRCKSCVKKIFKKKNDCYCPPKPVVETDKNKKENEKKDEKNDEVGARKSRVEVAQAELEAARRKLGIATSFGLPKCNKDICQCHYPPAYNQYFSCTGQVSGNCSCDKNV